MLNRRGIYLNIVRICLGLLFVCLLSTSIFARQIALFYDPLSVDINEGSVFAEASNLKASLELFGHEVILFTDFSSIQGADFDLVIIPELEKQDLTQSLSSSQFNIYKNYVEDGGAIIIMGVVSSIEFQGNNAIKFINEIKGSNMRVGQPVLNGLCIKNPNFPNVEFASAPDEINNNNAVVYIQPDLPSGANILYHHEADPTQAAVAEFKVGEGSLMYFGWGWWNAIPFGSQDGGWLSLLEISIETLSCDHPVLHLDDKYEFSLELNGKFGLTEDDFFNQYSACTNVSMSFSQSDFGCSDIDTELTIEVSLTDELERVVKQDVTIVIVDLHEVCDLQPQSLQLTGTFQIMNGNPLKNVELTLAAENTQNAISDENGSITISQLDKDEYFVSLHKEAFLAKQVTSYDLTLLRRHVLKLESFTSPYQYLAADLNGDKILDVQDMTLMRALVLNLDTEDKIPNNWLWVDKGYSFDDDAQNPLLQDWDTIQESILDLENLQLKIIGVKIGDIDSSYQDD